MIILESKSGEKKSLKQNYSSDFFNLGAFLRKLNYITNQNIIDYIFIIRSDLNSIIFIIRSDLNSIQPKQGRKWRFKNAPVYQSASVLLSGTDILEFPDR